MLAQGLNTFIQTQGYSFIAMGSVLLGAVINIVLDPIFIFTLNMGVSGSSLATVISQFCSCVCIIWFFFTEKSLFHFRVEDMRLKIIGLILPVIENPFFTQLASAIEKKADESGYRLLLCNTNGDLEKEKSALSMLASMNVTLITIDNAE